MWRPTRRWSASLAARHGARRPAAAIEGLSAWTDAALLNAAGIPAICYGPGDISLAHSATEWVSEERESRARPRSSNAWRSTGAEPPEWPT